MIDNTNKKNCVYQIIELTEQISKKFADGDDEEKQWMIQKVKNPILKDLLPNITIMMLHVLDAIGKYEPVNGITISKEMDIPKGTVSKITRKLESLDLIRKEKLPDNKKEILFLTTSLGYELFEVHKKLHEQIEKNVVHFLNQYQTDELSFITRLLEDTLKQSWVQLTDKTSSK